MGGMQQAAYKGQSMSINDLIQHRQFWEFNGTASLADRPLYYLSFPYTSDTKMSCEDLIELKRYLDAQPGIQQTIKAHELKLTFCMRPLLPVRKNGSISNRVQQGTNLSTIGSRVEMPS